ncbi:hypothetical protein BR63_10800 [Thermanaerosceptrum fracticalcis]|uniref:TPM domain-containing protein n=1 Tax=Thermanaerosceptrum fracticalcis TaxID=1712410 RepID=A0A7G6E8J1_THEFR|nr:hypothetical protein BR63_10800 [Thermanaerosceptrum fracticalcis]
MNVKQLQLKILFSLIVWSVPTWSADPPIPNPTSSFYVLDKANILSESTEQTIIQTSAELARKTKAQIVAVTVNTLEGYSPEDYALAILRKWGIGDKQLNNDNL